jgi:hypothetical protein
MHFMKKHTTAILLLLVFGEVGAEEPDNPSLQQRFAATIAPLVKTHCVKCHGAKAQEGEVTLHDIGIDPSNGKSVAQWSRVLEQLETGAMPPADELQSSAVQREQMVGWIKATLIAAGKGFELESKLLQPEHGNRVNHDLLFSGEINTPPFTPARLWRMSPHVYRGKRNQQQVAGGIEAEPVAYASKSSDIRDFASQEIVDESGFQATCNLSSSVSTSRPLPGSRIGCFRGLVSRLHWNSHVRT